MSANPSWQPISEDGIKEHRRHLPKGYTRETNTAHTVGYDQVESDDDSVVLTPAPRTIQEAAIPREVAEDIYGMMWKWASGSRENFAVMASMIRKHQPDTFGHLTDDELATKLEQHAKDAARAATEKAYEKFDKGNDLDMWTGKPLVYGKVD